MVNINGESQGDGMTPQERLFLRTIGENLKAKRKESLGYRSIAKLSRLSGVTKPMINKMEVGDVNPSILILKRVAGALECEIGDLLP